MATTRTKSKAGQTRSFTLTLTQGERARAERLAKREDRSVSSLLRLALKDYCDRAEARTGNPAHDDVKAGPGPWPHNPFHRPGPV